MRVLTVFGTRPEAIKLAPLVRGFERNPEISHACCVTGQHREMLDQVLKLFDITPQFDLDLMRPGQDLAYLTSVCLTGIYNAIKEFKPDWVVVQGDTTTALAGALAAFYNKVKVAHIEAGLRTGNIYSPWPEEANRKLVSQLATHHFPPTEGSARNLLLEGVSVQSITTTGNTVIDALKWVSGRFARDEDLRQVYEQKFSFLNPGRRMILVTGHRRENFDGGLEEVCRALRRVVERGDVDIVYPVHLNPNVQTIARAILGDHPAIHLIEPQEYIPFVYLMQRAYVIVTDSGGIQEEAPSLGKPVLVTRDTTERPEAIEAGTARLVGTDAKTLEAALTQLLDQPEAYEAMAKARNPFGDGYASQRIINQLLEYHTQYS